MQTISSNLTVAYDNKNYYPLSTCIAIVPKDKIDRSFNIKSLLLLMNSKLMNFYYDFTFNLGAHLTTEISVNNINRLPLKMLNEHHVFIMMAESMNRMNEKVTKREENKSFIEILDDLINISIYEIMFSNKFQSDGLNTNIISRVSQYVANRNPIIVEQIKDCIKNIQDDEDINFERQCIKKHPWIKIIEDYFKK